MRPEHHEEKLHEEASRPFLAHEDLDRSSFSEDDYSPSSRQSPSSRLLRPLVIALAASVIANVLTVATFFSNKVASKSPNAVVNWSDPLKTSDYADLTFDRKDPWVHYTPYATTNLSEAASLWDDIDFDSGFIALDYEYAEAKGLPKSQPFPWDDTKGIYLINAYHSLHCLKSIHQFIRELSAGAETSFPIEHITHCLDSLRMEAICTADDTPRWTSAGIEHFLESGVGQPRQCRDFSKLSEWAHEHHACYGRIDELHQCQNQMERYKFCPENSPYQDLMHQYFREVMHRELPPVVPREKGRPGKCDMSKDILGGGFSGQPSQNGKDHDGYN